MCNVLTRCKVARVVSVHCSVQHANCGLTEKSMSFGCCPGSCFVCTVGALGVVYIKSLFALYHWCVCHSLEVDRFVFQRASPAGIGVWGMKPFETPTLYNIRQKPLYETSEICIPSNTVGKYA